MEQSRFSPASILAAAEKGICVLALVFLVLIAASESFARIFGASVPSASNLLAHILLLLGLFSGMFTAKTGEHLSIVLVQFIKND